MGLFFSSKKKKIDLEVEPEVVKEPDVAEELDAVPDHDAPLSPVSKEKPLKKSSTLKKIKAEELEKSKEMDESVESALEVESKKHFSIESLDEPIAYDILTFYSQPIRKLYIKNKLYFVLEDFISLTGTVDLIPYIARFKKSREYQKNVPQYIVSVPILVNENEEIVDCIVSDGCPWLIEVLRYNQRFFPGPFPTWIANIE